MNYKEIMEEIKNNKNLVGIKMFWAKNDKSDYTIYKKKVIYNTMQKSYEDGLIHCIECAVSPNYKKCEYEGIYNINELHY